MKENSKTKQEEIKKPTWIRISIVQIATEPERSTKKNKIGERNLQNKARNREPTWVRVQEAVKL